MTKQIKADTVYCSNQDGEAARVTREFVSALFYQLLTRQQTVDH